MSDQPLVTVIQNASKPQYDIVVEGEVVGFTEYEDAGDGVHRYVHTEIEPEHGGKGYGEILVRSALDAERAAGHTIEAVCPYVAKVITDHPEYGDLLAD